MDDDGVVAVGMMGTRLTTTHGPGVTSVWRPATALLVAVALLAMQVVPASAASGPCLVTNVDTSETLTALQEAVDAGSPGNHITVEGTCHGITIIDKDLVITGIQTQTSGRPILDGDGLGSVVTVRWVAVTIRDLTIEDGASPSGAGRNGGGITQRGGTLALINVIVRGSHGRRGGGILSTGTLTLSGATRISGNDSGRGGGVYILGGTLTMNDRSSIRGNEFTGAHLDGATVVMNGHSSIRGNPLGSGVRMDHRSALTMNDSASITRNTAGNSGGGVRMYDHSALTMNDSSTITRNTAGTVFERQDGGGIYVSRGGGRATGVICAPMANANVYGNSPDDCVRNGIPF
jgi:hypothetical protein